MTAGVANLIHLVRRLLTTPSDQPGLLLDRLNDLDVALWEYDHGIADEDEEGYLRAPLSYENREGDPNLNGAFDKW
jgi:hypothetical protein